MEWISGNGTLFSLTRHFLPLSPRYSYPLPFLSPSREAHTGAARAGIDNLTKTLALEWAPYGIRVNSLAPGVIKTEGADKNYHDGFYPAALAKTPLGRSVDSLFPLSLSLFLFFTHLLLLSHAYRLGNGREIATLLLVLASDKLSGFVTGETLFADGGQRLKGHYMEDSWVGRAKL